MIAKLKMVLKTLHIRSARMGSRFTNLELTHFPNYSLVISCSVYLLGRCTSDPSVIVMTYSSSVRLSDGENDIYLSSVFHFFFSMDKSHQFPISTRFKILQFNSWKYDHTNPRRRFISLQSNFRKKKRRKNSQEVPQVKI